MRRVLVVDDEKFIRKGIKAIIERANTDFEEVIECSNGIDALDKLKQYKVDLIITDIRMPKMDGLALLKEMEYWEEKPKAIIVSGYDDFNYAREAIKYGVKEYLLKPIKEEELLGAVRIIKKQLDQKNDSLLRHQRLKHHIDEFRINELNYMLISSDLEKEKIQSMLKATETYIFNQPFYIALVYVQADTYSFNSAVYSDILKKSIDEYCSDNEGEVLSFSGQEDNVVLVVNNKRYIQDIFEYIKGDKTYKCVIGVSQLGIDVKDIHKAYLQALECLKYRLLTDSSKSVIYYEHIASLERNNNIDEEAINKVAYVVGTKNIKELDQLLFNIFDKEIKKFHISYTEKIVEYFNSNIIDYLLDKIKEYSPQYEEEHKFIKDIFKYKSLQEYIHSVKEFLLDIDKYLIALGKVYNQKNDIDTAIEFIKENYYKDLNMAYVSNYVSMNYSYFSEMFKEHTGTNFVDYVKKIRVEKSKVLLRNTDYKIFEIGQKIGYQNPKQFTKTFKEIVGISPVEFRNKPF